MPSLILRPSSLIPAKPWALQLRWHDLSGTDYRTIARVSDATAQDIINAGAPYWLFGEPDWAKIEEKWRLEEARKTLEDAGFSVETGRSE